MSDPYVREVGTVTDMDGNLIRLGVDYDSVTIAGAVDSCLTAGGCESLGRLFVAACWEAGRNGTRMAEEAAVPP